MLLMSRIITNNYHNRLKKLIEESEISPNFDSFLDFFCKEIESDQKRKGSSRRKVFSNNHLEKLKEIQESEYLKRIYTYLKIIIEKFTGHYLHIHINEDLSESTLNNIVSLFAWEALVNCSYNEELLLAEMKNIQNSLSSEIILPAGTERIPGIRNNNTQLTNQIYKERNGLRHRLKFIKKINNLHESNLNRGLLINLNSSDDSCVNLSDYSVFSNPLNTYVNFGEDLDFIFNEGNDILQKISTIINLFPVTRGRNIWYQNFIAEIINNWNQLPEYEFAKVITITSGEKIPEKLLETQRQNRFQVDEMYTIFSFEL